jgi:hypothetical protein
VYFRIAQGLRKPSIVEGNDHGIPICIDLGIGEIIGILNKSKKVYCEITYQDTFANIISSTRSKYS